MLRGHTGAPKRNCTVHLALTKGLPRYLGLKGMEAKVGIQPTLSLLRSDALALGYLAENFS